MDHENAQSNFHDGIKNETKVASILIQQSVLDTKQVAWWLAVNTQQGHLGSIKMIRKSKKKSLGAGRWVT